MCKISRYVSGCVIKIDGVLRTSSILNSLVETDCLKSSQKALISGKLF